MPGIHALNLLPLHGGAGDNDGRDVMKLTKKKAIELHRELWDWLYHNPSKEKEDWPGWGKLEKAYGGIFLGMCFPCEYARKIQNPKYPKSRYQCDSCPLAWPQFDLWQRTSVFCYQEGTPYYKWTTCKTPRTRKKYAKLIRDLPERGI